MLTSSALSNRIVSRPPTFAGPLAVLVVVLSLFAGACGTNDDPADPARRLCGGESGIAMSVTGRAEPVELCVGADDVAAILTLDARYDVRASATVDGVTYDIQMLFSHREDWPVELTVTGDLSAAASDPGAVWIFYQEIPDAGEALESQAASGGTFTLAFSGGNVATGTFSGVRFEMRGVASGQAAGSRTVAEGFFAISTDPE